MNSNKADLILHPVRMKIIQTLLSYESMTVQQLLEKLDDVAQATMYRHLKQLLDADLIEVIATNKVRGTIEKTYAVKKANIILSETDLKDTTSEEHIRYFMAYQANLLKEFERYVTHHQTEDFKEDGLGYRQMTLQLSKVEMDQLGMELAELLQKYVNHKPDKERSARTFSMIFIPQK
ncbi:helix-turn-helix domain-containing protein [Halalkalibacter akibai]|uniref:HTH arsR-type domain-containing protein n=1 Tax=Halalkalibacter akibai (strain ATCC 43226 / DSM 21942 / CIP 109018 / JCM 9157 / 1139) TaxID=1236973 RepID=W4QWG9_HALA3|nr:helix-turn-helix domain-containing protein [Halalkalibacter akibai]GAE36262.1 hypothetical protein JCM9157_3421 [Halalkalibacter akibai JCM 9157]